MVVKIIELVGTSTEGWEDATNDAVAEASKSVRGITRVIVNGLDVKVENDKIVEYRADVRISFRIER